MVKKRQSTRRRVKKQKGNSKIWISISALSILAFLVAIITFPVLNNRINRADNLKDAKAAPA